MASAIPAAATIGAIARRFAVQIHRVQYVVKSRKIKPVALAGNARVFGEDDVRRIGNELASIESRRELANTSSSPQSPEEAK